MSTIGPWVDEDGVRHDPLGDAPWPKGVVRDLTDEIDEALAHERADAHPTKSKNESTEEES